METRSVPILLGRKSYIVKTSLDDIRLASVRDILNEAVAQSDPALEQDERMFLTALILAGEIENASRRLRDALRSEDDDVD